MNRSFRIAALGFLLTLVVAACGSRVVPLEIGAVGPGGQPLDNTTTGTTGGTTTLGTTTGTGTTGSTTGTTGTGSTSGPVPNCRPNGATDVGVTNDTIRIGMVVAQTGAFRGQFDPNIEAVDAYLKMINADEGGVCGRKLVLYKRDDGGNANNDLIYA
ncbi:MAG: ABC transporter substrate-binding protein, partial [Nocardioidaceae bacterium]